MKLIFGMNCDGRSYPDFPGSDAGVFNAAVVGGQGLVESLEIQLGLTRPAVAQAVRIAAYAAKLRAALAEDQTLFFDGSFNLDSWATATSLLEWRDHLVACGWLGHAVGQPRLDAFAHVEQTGVELPPGLGDRAHTVCRALRAGETIGIDSIDLVEPRELLAPPWKHLVDSLETSGVVIERVPGPGVSPGDLGRVQTFLAQGTVAPLVGDGSFVVIDSDTALGAAEAVAEWLAHCPEDALHGTVVVSADGDTAMLDRALQARGLPALGLSAASPWRGALQVLPLAFTAAWAPFNAKAMLDLLMLPRPPIPRYAARKLARALSQEPGTGGAAWANAWSEIEADLTARLAELPPEKQDVAGRISAWQAWTTGGLYRRDQGMPADAAKAIATRVGQWAFETDAGQGDPLLHALARAAGALVRAVDLLGLSILPHLLVGRMIDQVLAEGAQNPDHFATAGGLRSVRSPGAIWSDAPRILWWGFNGPGDRVPSSQWTNEEVETLTAAGCRIEAPAACVDRIGWSYANAVQRAGACMILVSPALSAGEETVSHPLAHQLNPLTELARGAIRWSAEMLIDGTSHHLAGRDLVRQPAAQALPPRQRAHWSLPASVIGRLDGRVESASSFEHLVDCQLRWLLLDVLRISRGRVAEIPGPDQLFGNLAHELANRVLPAGPAPDPDTVLARVEALFDELLGAIATPLQQPEYAGELASARVRIPAALAQLAQLLHGMGIAIVGTEVEREKAFAGGLAVRGRLDLLVRHSAGDEAVIDLKWTKSAKRRRNELAEGRAFQLATYGAIADPASPTPVPGGYYLLNQRRLVGLGDNPLVDDVVDASITLPETWENLFATWQEWRDLARDGSAIATGAEGAEDHISPDLAIPPGIEPCRFCELTALCRVGVEAN